MRYVASDGTILPSKYCLNYHEARLKREKRAREANIISEREKHIARGNKAHANSAWHQAVDEKVRKRKHCERQKRYLAKSEFADLVALCHRPERKEYEKRYYERNRPPRSDRRAARLAKLWQRFAGPEEGLEAFLARLDAHRALSKPLEGSRWFLCPPNLLDTTGGTGLSTYARIPHHQLFRRIDRPFGTLPEYNKRGSRRCCAVHHRGHRCTRYSVGSIFCNFHSRLSVINTMNLPSTQYTVRNGKLKALLSQHMADTGIRDLKGEVALVRTMLSVQIEQMDDLQNLGDISLPQMGTILSTTKLLSEMVEKMVNIENKMQSKLSIEQLNEIISRLFDSVVRVCAPTEEQCLKLSEEIAGMQVLRDVAVAPTYGEDVVHGIEGSNNLTLHKRDGTYEANALNPIETIERNERFRQRITGERSRNHDENINLSPITLPSHFIKAMALAGAKGLPKYVEAELFG